MARRSPAFSPERPSLEYLAHRGPQPVVEGDLGEIGVPGIVFAPQTGPRCAAVVLAHGYLQPVGRYAETLRLLASWGFVAAAPATERALLPAPGALAIDVRRALDRLADAKLARGRVTVDRSRLAVIGHGMGGAAAALAAAAAAPRLAAVVTVNASAVGGAVLTAAAAAAVPSLHILARPGSRGVDEGEALAGAWAGPARALVVKGAHPLDFVEGKHLTSTLVGHRSARPVRHTERTLIAAFLLAELGGQQQLSAELDGPLHGVRTLPPKAQESALDATAR